MTNEHSRDLMLFIPILPLMYKDIVFTAISSQCALQRNGKTDNIEVSCNFLRRRQMVLVSPLASAFSRDHYSIFRVLITSQLAVFLTTPSFDDEFERARSAQRHQRVPALR